MPPAKRPSLIDVAREAGVSIATVSRVLNEQGPVRPETRALVLKTIARLHYTPDLQARALAGRDSNTIGMIISNIENPFFVDVYRSLEQEAHRLGREVLVANTGYDPERLAASVRIMLGRRVTGIAAIISEMEPSLLKELVQSGVPVVMYDVGGAGRNIVNVRVDYAAGMRETVELLYGMGHRHFAFVGHHTALSPLSVRWQAFTTAMEQLGSPVRHQVVTNADSLDGGYRAAHQLLDAGNRPTAIVCINDLMATGVLRGLRDRGIDVPGDISVTGFDNVPMSQYLAPQLTTVDVPRAEIGRIAAERLIQPKRARGQISDEILITPKLIVRESTGPAA